MEYRNAIDRLLSLVDHERTGIPNPRQKRIFDLGRMEAFLDRLGNPHKASKTVHVAGTKGKGSTAALCDAALRAAGYNTGFYSSPHLHSFRERIRVNSQPVSETEFSRLVEQLWPVQEWIGQHTELGNVTLFEFMTGMAFQCFSERRSDFQVIEVGLGGRLDATNVVDPDVCVITPVSRDHTAILGDTIAEIASEKAGIIKPGKPVVVAPQVPEARRVILETCLERSATPVQVGKDVTWKAGPSSINGQHLTVKGLSGEYQLRMPLLGKHQLDNAAAAVGSLECLMSQGHSISGEAIQRGFESVVWPCRMEVLGRAPLVIADGAHNDDSVNVLLDSVAGCIDYRRLLLVVGFSRDKSVSDMVGRLAEVGPVVFACRSRHPRSTPPKQIVNLFRENSVEAVDAGSTAGALAQAKQIAGEGDLILVTGSLFIAAEAREYMLGIEPEVYPDLLPPDLRQDR